MPVAGAQWAVTRSREAPAPERAAPCFCTEKRAAGQAARRQSRKAKGLAVSCKAFPVLVFKFKYYIMVYSHVICSPPLVFGC